MLNANKHIYESAAQAIPDWSSKTKSELILGYSKYKDSNSELANAYMAAIMLKYWNTLDRYYYGSVHTGRIYKEDCYDWLTEAVMTVIKDHVWDREFIYKKNKDTGEIIAKPNKLYNNPDAPNIALNQCIISMRLGFYQSSNYNVRKINYTLSSIDDILDRKKEYVLPFDEISDVNMNLSLAMREMVKNYFNRKKYHYAFILEGILNGDVFDKDSTGVQVFNRKKLVKHLRHLTPEYCRLVSNTFNTNLEETIETGLKYMNLPSAKLYKIIDFTLENLKPEVEEIVY